MCVDVGSTYTKASLIDGQAGAVCGTAQVPTTVDTDVWHGVRQVRDQLAARDAHAPAVDDRDRVRICSSAGGGLRLAVVGFERVVSAEAGQWVALSAGARIVHICDGDLGHSDIASLRESMPDLVLLVGGTDGGNSGTLLRNAATLAGAGLSAATIVAGNNAAAPQARDIIAAAGGVALCADNVLPRIGHLAPESARGAIRSAFLQHVIAGKALSSHRGFAASVRAPTPDAVLDGVAVLRAVADQDVMVIDIGGATTDVYSALLPYGEDQALAKDVIGLLPLARSVEADLGMRHSAPGVLRAALSEGVVLPPLDALSHWVEQAAARPDRVPRSEVERRCDGQLARHAAVLAARRHGRPAAPGHPPRALSDVGILVGSGGVLRHSDRSASTAVLQAVLNDHGGGWRPPARARLVVDRAYLLAGIGLLAQDYPHVAATLAASLLDENST
ncbi:MAG: glutamate mutase L [Ornithinimicrobium sp.]